MELQPVFCTVKKKGSNKELDLELELQKSSAEHTHINLAKFWQRAQIHSACCLRLAMNLVLGAQGPFCYS